LIIFSKFNLTNVGMKYCDVNKCSVNIWSQDRCITMAVDDTFRPGHGFEIFKILQTMCPENCPVVLIV